MKTMKRKSIRSTLSDKIADALTVKPRADIEDDQIFQSKPRTLTRAEFSSSDSEEDAVISDFRKQNVNLLSDISKKYEGKVVTRKYLQEQSRSEEESGTDSDKDNLSGSSGASQHGENNEHESDNDDEDESDDYSITNYKKQPKTGNENEQSSEGSDEEEDGSYDISQIEEPIKEEFEHVKKQDISEETKQGNSVRNQLLVWEGLLEIRIHLQRCMNTANRMPMTDHYHQLKDCDEFTTECTQTINNVTNVLEKFLSLQNILLRNHPETKALVTKKQNPEQTMKDNSDEEIPSDTDNEEIPSDTDSEEKIKPESTKTIETISKKKRKIQDYESEIEQSHKIFKTFRDTTIKKWNDKTRLATAANMKNAPTNSILQQISYILSDRDKLIRRTQLKRSEYDIIGYKPLGDSHDKNVTEINSIKRDRKDNDEYIPEIFDDSDFYHQLLRELIECKSADISDPVQLSRQWIALQQMRSKMKRKVDTKATKGRRLKYVVHNPLVNYMAPEKSLTWSEENTSELYNSLFGKMFERNNIGVNVNFENKKY